MSIGLISAAFAAAVCGGTTMSSTDIPAKAPNDSIMAKPGEIGQMAGWAAHAFGGSEAAPRLSLVHQDYGILRFGRSVMNTPLKLHGKAYKHGIGTHANSVILVTLPEGATRFEAHCGIDDNYDTQGTRGSAVFSVEVDGHVCFKSPVLRGSDEGAKVDVPIPAGAKELRLQVETTPDGPAYDQSDWADAQLALSNGRHVYLEDTAIGCPLFDADPPFSFRYGGSKVDLSTWKRETTAKTCPGYTEYRTKWTAADTPIVVEAVAKAYERYPAVDWVLYLSNAGAQDTLLIEDIRALDATLNLGGKDVQQTLHRLAGDNCSADNFHPIDETLSPYVQVHMAPVGGRSSQATAFPIFDIENGAQGIVAAVGWSGQWATDLERTDDGTRIAAGMESTHLVLHPGERIRTPRIVLMSWQGNRLNGLNRWRRLMLHNYTPQIAEQPIRVPFSMQCFDRYSWKIPEWSTERGQIEAARAAAKVGCDTHWFDAAWFPGGFPDGVGNWSPKPKEFPRGLKPISNECHKLGIGFLLWFEPERVGKDTEIARDHPDWVFGGANGGLYRLDLPEARQWMTDLLSKRIDEFGLDVYRQDFNMDPLDSWRANDAPNRHGMTEIRYVEGLYAMWDELLRRHPGLRIDDCSSGGRRIDIEMLSRSMPLWRSDIGCGPGSEEYAQSQTSWISRYLPIHATCAWDTTAYAVRSAATTGLAAQFDYLSKAFPWAKAKALIREVRENAKYWYGDFYALTPAGNRDDEFVAYQFHRPDLDAGIVLAFRRAKSATVGLILAPEWIKPAVRYSVDYIDEDLRERSVQMAGAEILKQGLELRIPNRRASLLVRYRPAARR
jgi:alpha-galactosidase